MDGTESKASLQESAERWLSAARFKPYLDASDNDVEAALALYEWNIDLGLVLMKDISAFEVALRNAYDRVLSDNCQDGKDWLFDPASPVNKPIMRHIRSGSLVDMNTLNREQIAKASGPHHNKMSHDGVVSNLSFGFWAHLTDKAHERDLWIPVLHKAWPRGTNRAELDKSLRAITECRNRIAHHERLFNPRREELLPIQIDRELSRLMTCLLPGFRPFETIGSAVEDFGQQNMRAVRIGFDILPPVRRADKGI